MPAAPPIMRPPSVTSQNLNPRQLFPRSAINCLYSSQIATGCSAALYFLCVVIRLPFVACPSVALLGSAFGISPFTGRYCPSAPVKLFTLSVSSQSAGAAPPTAQIMPAIWDGKGAAKALQAPGSGKSRSWPRPQPNPIMLLIILLALLHMKMQEGR